MKKSNYSQLPDDGGQNGSLESKHQQTTRFTPKRGLRTWAITLWPLILHFVMAIGILIFVVRYVHDRHFNVTERRPKVPLADGTKVRLSGYKPLQTDITTSLSSAFVVLRLISAAWAHSLYWRGAFFLMDPAGPGLQKRDLELMIGHGVFTLRTYMKDIRIFNVGMILLVTCLAQAASPMLTGSISWVPSDRLAQLRNNDNLTVDIWGTWNREAWNRYINDSTRREWTVRRAAGHINLAWGRDVERDVMKRVIPNIAPVNNGSIIRNVTLPYFSVTALEWIPDPVNTLPPEQLNITHIQSILSSYDTMSPLQAGVGAFIPAAAWSPAPFPSASSISETRTLIMHTHDVKQGETCSNYKSSIYGSLPPTMGIQRLGDSCYGFARVTYRAGAGMCNHCRVSSYSTVRNVTVLPLEDSAITAEALRLMADVSAVLVHMNSIVSTPMGDINDYVIGLLARSYSAAWCSLTFTLNDEAQPLRSRYSPSVPTTRAWVDLKRAYGWFAIQLLMTFSGAIFLVMQSESECRLMGETTLVALKLDTTEANTVDGHEQLSAGGLLKLKPQDGRLKIVVQANKGVTGSIPMKGTP